MDVEELSGVFATVCDLVTRLGDNSRAGLLFATVMRKLCELDRVGSRLSSHLSSETDRILES